MKKFYLLSGAVMFCALTFAQEGAAPYKSNKSVVFVGSKYAHEIKAAHHVQSDNTNRGGIVYFTEDFENGLSGNNTGTQTASGSWVTAISAGANPVVGWELTTVGHANDAGSTFNIPALLSTTGIGAAGQWMLLDSDSDGTSGIDEEATLTSPTIDFGSVAVNTLALEWQQFFGEWQNDSLFVEISIDNGATWAGTSVSNGVGRDNRPNPEYMRIDLTPYALAGETQVKIRFRWKGQWDYGWQVDDVQIVDLPDHNLRLQTANATHYTVHPLAVQAGFSDKIAYTKIPGSQTFPMSFTGNISNLGALPQTNVTLSVDVNSGTYTASSTGISLTNGDDSTVSVVGTFTPGASNAVYDAAYEIGYDNVLNEDDPTGLFDTSKFEVTTSEFSRDKGYYSGAGLWNGESGSVSNSYQMGHVWQITSTETLEGISVVLSGSTDAGVIAYGSIYEIDTATGDYVFINNSSDVDVLSYNIPAAASSNPNQLWIPMQQTLTAGKQYIICLGHYGGPDALVIGNSTDMNATSYTTFLLDGTDNTWYYLTATPMIRLHFDVPAWVGVEEYAANNGIELGQNMPNPGTSITQISYSIANPGNVSLVITDITGKVVRTLDEGFTGAGSYSVNLNLSGIAPGIYNYTLLVDGASATKRMIISE